MKISYAITVCNEFVEIQRLLPLLSGNISSSDEIVVLYDSKNGNNEIESYLRTHSDILKFRWYSDEFDGHFANWKNKLNSYCSGDYIFQIDADEYPSTTLIQNISEILSMNEPDLILVPRVNTVDGLTEQHIQKWGWNVNKHGWVNWPDPQFRIYKNNGDIRWENRVHEKIVGNKTISTLPWDEAFALYHPKDIKRQEKQNAYYETLS